MVGDLRLPSSTVQNGQGSSLPLQPSQLAAVGEDQDEAAGDPDLDLVDIDVKDRETVPGDGQAVFSLSADATESLVEPQAPLEGLPCPAHVATDLLKPLSEPVPDNWVTLDQRFIQVAATYQTHLARDFFVSSECRLNDGLIHLAVTPGECTRRQIMQQFTDFQEGNIMDNPDVEVIKVRAFRLEPITTPGHMTVDGELVDYGPIQGQVLPSMARIMAMSPPAN